MSQQNDARKTQKSDKMYDAWLGGIADGVLRTQHYIREIQEERPTLIEVRIKCDPDDERGVLVILKGYLGNQDMVAFHRDENYAAAVTSVGNRLRNGSLRWKEDHGYKSE